MRFLASQSAQVPALMICLENVPGAFATDKRKCDTQRLMEKSQARFVMLDSGGFQLLNAEKAEKEISFDATRPLKNSIKLINLTPEHVVQAASELQPDILVALDFPIDTISNPKEQEEEFKRKFIYNVKWARKTAELRQQVCPRIALFIPLQAYRIGQVDRFLESIQDVGFDGISMPVRNQQRFLNWPLQPIWHDTSLRGSVLIQRAGKQRQGTMNMLIPMTFQPIILSQRELLTEVYQIIAPVHGVKGTHLHIYITSPTATGHSF